MSGPYTVYKIQTGKVVKVLYCPMAVLPLQIEDDETYINTAVTDPNMYINTATNKPEQRPTLKATLQGMTIYGVPDRSQIIIEGVTYTADGKPIELEFNMPGTYLITVVCWPFLDWSVSVEAKT